MGSGQGDYEFWSRRVDSLIRRLGDCDRPGFESGGGWSPPTDVFETADGVVVKMELPGVSADGLSIVLVGDRLVVRGRRLDAHSGRKIQYHQMEISYGSFAKVVYIRMGYDRNGIKAHLADGYLNLVIPKTNEPVIQKIAVEIRL
jgi:HSP20 family protein